MPSTISSRFAPLLPCPPFRLDGASSAHSSSAQPFAHRAPQFILTVPGALQPARPCLGFAHRYSHMMDGMGFACPEPSPTLPRGSNRRSLIAHASSHFLPLSCQLRGMDHLLIPFTTAALDQATASSYWTSICPVPRSCGQTRFLNATLETSLSPDPNNTPVRSPCQRLMSLPAMDL